MLILLMTDTAVDNFAKGKIESSAGRAALRLAPTGWALRDG